MSTDAGAQSPTVSASRPAFVAFGALLMRDVFVLRRTFKSLLLRTVMQPMLFVFVFAYVFPRIGQGIGGSGAAAQNFSTLLAPGLMAIGILFQGIQSTALPLVQEFGYTREIEDRVMAPMPVWALAVEKIFAGAIQSAIAGLVVLPLALTIPATPVHLHPRWGYLLVIFPLVSLLGASLGLAVGTRAQPQQVPLVFSVIVMPMTMLGATYYPWAALSPIPWLKWAVLINPLVYISEGLRLALTPEFKHMPVAAVLAALVVSTAALAWLGIDGFRRRVLS